MDFYTLKIGNLERKLPIISLTPKIKVASFNLLGDGELVEIITKKLAKKLKDVDFDYLVGPEVKVVPILQELSRVLKKKRYIVCRKEIHGYMISPIKTPGKHGLVLNGSDAKLITDKKVIIVDDVVSSGNTIKTISQLVTNCGAKVVFICFSI